MNLWGKALIVALLGTSIGCDLASDAPGITVFTHYYDFSQGQGDWTADFVDYPADSLDSVAYELKWSYTERPSSVGGQKSFMVSGNNHSDDLFMFLKRKVTGLQPNTDYNIGFDIEFASNAKTGSVGIGGSPASAVYLKAGASAIEPRRVIEGSQYRLNVDKGSQSTGGNSAIVLGDIGINAQATDYMLITRTSTTQNGAPFVVKTNAQGELWLLVGTDSGFEGKTTLYYTKISAVFSTTN